MARSAIGTQTILYNVLNVGKWKRLDDVCRVVDLTGMSYSYYGRGSLY